MLHHLAPDVLYTLVCVGGVGTYAASQNRTTSIQAQHSGRLAISENMFSWCKMNLAVQSPIIV